MCMIYSYSWRWHHGGKLPGDSVFHCLRHGLGTIYINIQQKYHTQTGSCTHRRCFSSHPACAGSFPSASVSPPSSCTWPWQPGLPYTPHCSALAGGLNMPRTTQTVRRIQRPLMLHASMSLPLGGAPFSFMRSAYS